MVTTMPAPVVAMPAYLFRLQLRGFLGTRDRRIDICTGRRQTIGACDRLRRQRRGLCTCNKRSCSNRDTAGEFQKIPALHDICFLKLLGE